MNRNEELWYGHRFKNVADGVWRCKCGKELHESSTFAAQHNPDGSVSVPFKRQQGRVYYKTLRTKEHTG